MTFPESRRVLYKDNTLEEVVCQVKFPTILKVAETPVEFQEHIRAMFPLLQQKPAIELPPNLPLEVVSLMSASAGNVFQFLSRDKIWTVSLFREFLALSCNRYQRWEEFREHFAAPFRALNEIYSPAFFARIGLRYRNVIQRKKLGLDNVPWSELLKTEICGELSASEIRDNVEQATREVIVSLGDGQKVRLMHGLADQGESYVIDADFFIESDIEVANVSSQLDAFNRESGRLIRWAITDKLHEAMGPNPV